MFRRQIFTPRACFSVMLACRFDFLYFIQRIVTLRLEDYKERVLNGKELPFMVDALNCAKGCLYGTAVEDNGIFYVMDTVIFCITAVIDCRRHIRTGLIPALISSSGT